MSEKMKHSGFNLIELLITLAIIAILLAIAVPNFQQLWLKSNRQQALQALYTLASKQEEVLLRSGQYQQNLSLTQAAVDVKQFQIEMHVETKNIEGRDYYRVKATAIDMQQKDTECLVFTIDSLNQRQAFQSDGSLNLDCWQP